MSANFIGTKSEVSTETITESTPGNYKPEGTISTPTFSGSIDLHSDTIAENGIKYVYDVSHTEASVNEHKNVISTITPSKTSVVNSLTTSTATSTGAIKYLEDVSLTGNSASAVTSYLHFDAGTLPSKASFDYISSVNGGSLSVNTTSTNGIKIITDMGSGSISSQKGDYTPAGNVNSIFTGSAATVTLKGTPTGTITITGGTSPSLATLTTSSQSYIPYVSYVTLNDLNTSTENVKSVTNVGTLPSLSFEDVAATGLQEVVTDVSSPSLQFETSSVITDMTEGNSTLSSHLNSTDPTILEIEVVYTAPKSIKTTGFSKNLKVNNGGFTKKYVSFDKGTLPTTSDVSVIKTVSNGGLDTLIRYLKFDAGSHATSATFKGDELSVTGSITPTGTISSSFTGIKTNSLVTDVTHTNPTITTSYLHYTPASGNSSSADKITSVGTLPSLTIDSTVTGGDAILTNFTADSKSISKTSKYISTSNKEVLEDITVSTTSVISKINGGSISTTLSYFHPTISGTIETPTFTGKQVRLVTNPTGTISITTTPAITVSIPTIKSIGKIPTIESVTVATGVVTQQPSFTGSFTGTSITPNATVSTTSVSIISTGNFTPSGSIGDVK